MDFADLPKDIIKLLAEYLDTDIWTILNKENREDYFAKCGVTIDCGIRDLPIFENCIMILTKYPRAKVRLISFMSRDMYTKLGSISKMVREIKMNSVKSLAKVLESFPNLRKIKGTIVCSAENINLIKKSPIDSRKIISEISNNDDIDNYLRDLPFLDGRLISIKAGNVARWKINKERLEKNKSHRILNSIWSYRS